METMNKSIPLGIIEIAPEVIETIASISASDVEGFHLAQGNFMTGINNLVKREVVAQSTKLTETEEGYVVDVYGAVDYGQSVPKLALALQEKIKEQLLFSCELEIAEVNVHVVHIIPAKSMETELFELGDDE